MIPTKDINVLDNGCDWNTWDLGNVNMSFWMTKTGILFLSKRQAQFSCTVFLNSLSFAVKSVLSRLSSPSRLVWRLVVHMGREAGSLLRSAFDQQRRRCFGGAVAQLQARPNPCRPNFNPLLWIEAIKKLLDVSREWWEHDCECLPWLGGGPLTQVGKGGGKSCLHFVPNGACAASASPHHLPGMDIAPAITLGTENLVHLNRTGPYYPYYIYMSKTVNCSWCSPLFASLLPHYQNKLGKLNPWCPWCHLMELVSCVGKVDPLLGVRTIELCNMIIGGEPASHILMAQ